MKSFESLRGTVNSGWLSMQHHCLVQPFARWREGTRDCLSGSAEPITFCFAESLKSNTFN